MRWVAGLLACVVMAWAGPAPAKVVTDAKVRYQTREGPGRWYPMEVTFLTGNELNTATSTFRYSAFSNYAVVFFGQGQAAVIKLRNVYCGMEFLASCVPSFGNAKGTDQDGTEWEVCTSSFC